MAISDIKSNVTKTKQSPTGWQKFWQFQWTPKGRAAQLGREYDKEQTDLQWKRNLEQWERENEYNAPKAQYERYQGSGLNPALMSGGSPVTAATSPKAGKAEGEFAAPEINLNILDKFMRIAQIKNISQNTEKQESETKNKNQDYILGLLNIDYKNLSIEQKKEYNRILKETGMQQAEANLNSTRATTYNTRQKTQLAIAQKASVKAAMAYTKDRAKGQRLANDFQKIINDMAADGIFQGDNKFWRTFWDYFRDSDSEMRQRNKTFYENALKNASGKDL